MRPASTTSAAGLLLGVASVMSLAPPSAEAYTYKYYCNGCPGSVGDTTVAIKRNTYSIPNGSAAHSAAVNADTEWNTNVASWAPAVLYGTTSDSGWESGDGVWEFGLVPRSTIDGANGKTVWLVGLCFIGCNDFDEEDILIANDMTYYDPDESQWTDTVSGRMTMVHEWGHMLGLGHQSGFDVMNTQQPNPYVGGSPTHVTALHDERRGVRDLYGYPGTHKNISASAQKWSSGVVTTTYVGTKYFCTGGQEWVSFSTVNSGLQTLTFDQRFFMNSCPTCYWFGYTAFLWNGGTVGSQGYYTWTTQMTMPSIPTGLYWTFHSIDTASVHSETRENDNYVHHALTVQKLGC